MIRRPAVLWVGVILVLSGCSAADRPSAEMEDPRPPGETRIGPSSGDAEDIADLGSIIGTVTDDLLVPLPKAAVRLVEVEAVVEVGTDGRFRFLDVPIGRHTVEAQAPGHRGSARVVELSAGEETEVRFALAAMPVTEPRIEILHHATLIHYGGFGTSELGPTMGTAGFPICSDDCRWWVQPDKRPSVLYSETFGEHSIPNPRGWDGFRIVVVGFALNDTSNQKMMWQCSGTLDTNPNADCLRLPVRFSIPGSQFDNEDDPSENIVERLRYQTTCEQTWICLDDHYETFVSLFFDWEGEEVPPGYSAKPDG